VANNAPVENQNADHNAPLVQPREVETMIVRPDGSIVQPSPAPEETASQLPPVNAAPPAATAPAGGDEIAALAAGNAPAEPAAQTPARQPQPAAEAPRLPVRAPVVPSRPAEEPVNIVGNVPQRTQAPA